MTKLQTTYSTIYVQVGTIYIVACFFVFVVVCMHVCVCMPACLSVSLNVLESKLQVIRHCMLSIRRMVDLVSAMCLQDITGAKHE